MVKIYYIPECPYCLELKTKLDNEKIPYMGIDVSLKENEEEFNKIVEFTKSESIPIVRVGQQILVPEISFKSIEEAFNLTKRFYKE